MDESRLVYSYAQFSCEPHERRSRKQRPKVHNTGENTGKARTLVCPTATIAAVATEANQDGITVDQRAFLNGTLIRQTVN